MFTAIVDEELKSETWTNSRMRNVVAQIPAQKWHDKFCPACRVHHSRHNNRKCEMRYTEEE